MADRTNVASEDGVAAQRWLLLIYRIPGEPTKLRSAVRLRVKRLGAVYLRKSVVGMPANQPVERELRQLRKIILGMSGSAVLLSCKVLEGESDMRAQFQSTRADEYALVTGKCAEFIANLNNAVAEHHFSYAELEKREADLVKLRKHLRRVQERDVMGSDALQAALDGLAECEQKLGAYTALVDAAESAQG